MSESQRSAVVSEARKWLGTPYHSNADVLGAGVDCGMLLVRVFVDTGLIDRFDPRPYPQDWHLHHSEERYLGFLTGHARRVEAPGLGDVMVFRYGRCFSHGGIVTALAPLTIVHAFIGRRKVVEEPVRESLELSDAKRREPRFYSFWG